MDRTANSKSISTPQLGPLPVEAEEDGGRPDAGGSKSTVVSAAARGAAAAGPVGVEEFSARFVHALVGVRAK